MNTNRQISALKRLAPGVCFAAVAVMLSPCASAQLSSAGTGISARPLPQFSVPGTAGTFSGLSYNLSEQLSIETLFRSPSAQVLGRAGLGSLSAPYATVGQTVMGQYRFGEEKHDFRPRLGAGLAYSLARTDRGTGLVGALHGESSEFSRPLTGRDLTGMGLAFEVGASYALSKSWYLEGSVIRSYIRSTGSALSASPGGGAPGLKIDPVMLSFSIGFKFQ